MTAAVATALLVAGPAQAATVIASVTGDFAQVTFTADANEVNDLRLSSDGGTMRFDDDVVVDDRELGSVCTQEGDDVTCRFAAGMQVNYHVALGDEDDRFTSSVAGDRDRFGVVNGGAGDDTLDDGADGTTLVGAAGDDTLSGAADDDHLIGGPGEDVLEGGAGDDELDGGNGDDRQNGGAGDDHFRGGAADRGADDLVGGDGFDTVEYSGAVVVDEGTPSERTEARGVDVILDGLANDGVAGERDNAKVENVTVFNHGSEQTNRIVGDAAANVLNGGDSSRDTIDGGGGNDLLFGSGGDDTIIARDGFADVVSCGNGTDSARTDAFDAVSACESDDAAGTAFATEDAPPQVAFGSPASGARIATATPTTIAATAADDRGVRTVALIDDGQVVATDTTAPYELPYQPRGGDVGSNTLALLAVDTSGQTATAFRQVEVERFEPRGVTARTTPSRDRTGPYRFVTTGRVDLPAGVTAAQGCGEGIVAVQVKRGTKTISTRRVVLRATCTYSSTVAFRDRSRLGRTGRLKVTVQFLGNEVLSRRSAPSRSVRAG